MTELTRERIMYCVEAEIQKSRNKFPSNKKILYAVIEESGELVKAMLDLDQGKGTANDVFKEGVQVIATVIRLLQEGDPDFSYQPDYEHYKHFDVGGIHA